eukprot:TRINITY_DN11184_c0_g1_i1.p1 TRINITY_DN11184_c0_g1~~TRINITY_DN11184_c0_g1_i1.p1  ORF type:complete len:322 (-),score=34.96 TRINITY_DN11184_c0_g1_i1:1009-1974(-)
MARSIPWLPVEILNEIVRYCEWRERSSLLRTNTQFRQLVSALPPLPGLYSIGCDTTSQYFHIEFCAAHYLTTPLEQQTWNPYQWKTLVRRRGQIRYAWYNPQACSITCVDGHFHAFEFQLSLMRMVPCTVNVLTTFVSHCTGCDDTVCYVDSDKQLVVATRESTHMYTLPSDRQLSVAIHNGIVTVCGGPPLFLAQVHINTQQVHYIEDEHQNRSATLCVYNGKVYCCGGHPARGVFSGVSDRLICYDPDKGTVVPLAPMPYGRAEHVLVGFGNRLFVIGGVDNRHSVKTIHSYSIEHDVWQTEENPFPQQMRDLVVFAIE